MVDVFTWGIQPNTRESVEEIKQCFGLIVLVHIGMQYLFLSLTPPGAPRIGYIFPRWVPGAEVEVPYFIQVLVPRYSVLTLILGSFIWSFPVDSI